MASKNSFRTEPIKINHKRNCGSSRIAEFEFTRMSDKSGYAVDCDFCGEPVLSIVTNEDGTYEVVSVT